MSIIKNAIVVLTKGYQDLSGYDLLVSRNISIFDNFYSKLQDNTIYDIIIFHEGNINKEAQTYIQKYTPNMPLIFTAIKFYDISKFDINSSSAGYKNMCYFWAIDFVVYLKDYEYIIRLDEDCILYNLDTNIIPYYKEKNIKYSSATFYGDDDEGFVIGLKSLFYSYMMENNLTPISNIIRCPYTNFSIINIPFYKNTKYIQDILEEIKKSNGIFIYRWGDLPIHGYILTFLTDPALYFEDKTIKYYHGSHYRSINN